MTTRRDFVAAGLVGILGGAVARGDDKGTLTSPVKKSLAQGMVGSEKIAILLYDGFTALDVFGPHHMFVSMMGAKVDLVAQTMDPIKTDTRVAVTPTTTFDDCPKDLTIFFVPGGSQGTLKAAGDKAIRQFVADRGGQAEWVASVCTGSVILGAAGLLKGYKATSHWLVRDSLDSFGAIPVAERVVIDRNRVTGAGVTAGLDFGLQLVGKMRGDAYAEAIQLFSEYDPQPPYNSGSPEKALPSTVQMLRSMHQSVGGEVRKIAESVMATNG